MNSIQITLKEWLTWLPCSASASTIWLLGMNYLIITSSSFLSDIKLILIANHSCWEYHSRVNKMPLPYALSHSNVVKRAITTYVCEGAPQFIPSSDAWELFKTKRADACRRLPIYFCQWRKMRWKSQRNWVARASTFEKVERWLYHTYISVTLFKESDPQGA